MGLISDLKQLWNGSYITVQEVAHGYETTEDDAQERLDRLVDEENVLRRLPGERYTPAEHLEGKEGSEEMVKAFNQEFSDLREELNTSAFGSL